MLEIHLYIIKSCQSMEVVMSEVKFERRGEKGTIIKNLETGESTKYDSANKAKRESRRLQMEADKALGRGSVRVVA